MSDQRHVGMLQQLGRDAVPEDLDLWPSIQNAISNRVTVTPARPRDMSRLWRRRSVIGGGLAAALAIVVGGTSPLWNRSQSASAEVILDQAQAAVSNGPGAVTTYHLQMTRVVPGKGNVSDSTEVWYGGADQQRTDQVQRDASGSVVSRQVVVRDGTQTWIALTDANGQTRVIHTTETAWNSAAAAPENGSSLAEVIAQYTNNKGCVKATTDGQSAVLGRVVYVIAARPDASRCPPSKSAVQVQKGSIVATKVAAIQLARPTMGEATPTSARGGGKAQFGQMTVWVDQQTFLPLRTEVRDASGALLERSEVTSLEYNVAIPASTFHYTPPAGATVSTFTGGTGADVKRALAGFNLPTPQKGKKPSP